MLLSKLEPENDITSLNFHPEVSIRRLSRVIQFLKDEENQFIEKFLKKILGDFYNKITKDNNLWVSANFEKNLLLILDKKFHIKHHVYNSGKELFLTEAVEILPSDGSTLSYISLIHKSSVLLQRFVSYLDYRVIESTETSCSIQLKFTSLENQFDLLFLKGLLEGTAILFQVKGWKLLVKQCRFSDLDEELLPSVQNREISDVPTEFLIHWESTDVRVGKTSFVEDSPVKAKETFVISRLTKDTQDESSYSYIDLNHLLNKSKELYLENRDLEAAVEVLSSLRKELVQKQKAISKDMKMARNIQRGIIPQNIPDWKGLQFSFSYLPMQEVSGDYYDYFNFGSDKIGIMISDVSGHGVPAAFITAISKLLFTNYKLDSPSQIFTNANRELIELVKQQGYLTCFYGIIDSNYKMTYCIAGHPRPLLYRASTGEVIVLEGEGTFLGMFTDADKFYKDYSIYIEPGDKLFLYTDGLLEGQSDTGEFFQQQNLIELIKKTGKMSAHEAQKFIMSSFDEFCKGTDQGDDITLVVTSLSPRLKEFTDYKISSLTAAKRKNFEEAYQELLKAKDIFPTDVNVLWKLSKYLIKLKRYSEAIEQIEEYQKFKTQNAEAHFLLGYCFYKLENFTKSESELLRAISIRNNYPDAFYYLAKIYYKQNQISQSVEYLKRLVEIDSKNTRAQKAYKKLKKIIY
jgi:serine phosphatase RsbU (regulator of sigma subunit)